MDHGGRAGNWQRAIINGGDAKAVGLGSAILLTNLPSTGVAAGS